MMAREINNLLQSEYVDTGIVDFNFHCSVFDEADNSVVIGEAWRVDIPNMADPTGTFGEKNFNNPVDLQVKRAYMTHESSTW